MAKHGGRTFSPVMSFATGLICTSVFFAIDVTALHTPLPTRAILGKRPKMSTAAMMTNYFAPVIRCAGLCLDRQVIICSTVCFLVTERMIIRWSFGRFLCLLKPHCHTPSRCSHILEHFCVFSGTDTAENLKCKTCHSSTS